MHEPKPVVMQSMRLSVVANYVLFGLARMLYIAMQESDQVTIVTGTAILTK